MDNLILESMKKIEEENKFPETLTLKETLDAYIIYLGKYLRELIDEGESITSIVDYQRKIINVVDDCLRDFKQVGLIQDGLIQNKDIN